MQGRFKQYHNHIEQSELKKSHIDHTVLPLLLYHTMQCLGNNYNLQFTSISKHYIAKTSHHKKRMNSSNEWQITQSRTSFLHCRTTTITEKSFWLHSQTHLIIKNGWIHQINDGTQNQELLFTYYITTSITERSFWLHFQAHLSIKKWINPSNDRTNLLGYSHNISQICIPTELHNQDSRTSFMHYTTAITEKSFRLHSQTHIIIKNGWIQQMNDKTQNQEPLICIILLLLLLLLYNSKKSFWPFSNTSHHKKRCIHQMIDELHTQEPLFMQHTTSYQKKKTASDQQKRHTKQQKSINLPPQEHTLPLSKNKAIE